MLTRMSVALCTGQQVLVLRQINTGAWGARCVGQTHMPPTSRHLSPTGRLLGVPPIELKLLPYDALFCASELPVSRPKPSLT
jgi:hypothetical protein